MIYIIKRNSDSKYACHWQYGRHKLRKFCHSSDIEKCGSDEDVIFFTSKEDALDCINNDEHTYNIVEIDCEPEYSSIRAHFYVKMLERCAMEREGCSLAESFKRFQKKQNEGKFLFSDLKKILDSMSQDELDHPVNIEVMGPMTYEQHNIIFTNGREMELAGQRVKSTGDCFVIRDDKLSLTVHEND